MTYFAVLTFRMRTAFWISLFIISSCKTPRPLAGGDGIIEIVIIQVNDVYEIAPIAGGKIGGMARVASLKKEYQKQNANTILVMAGDFLSPSVYNSILYNGKRIRGKQMIESMNAAGMDLAVFGNHEFDITESELQERLNESDFQWVSSNTFHNKKGKVVPFEQYRSDTVSIPKTLIRSFRDADGTAVKVGFIGLTLPFNKAEYVTYSDPLETAREVYNQIKDSCDAVVAITHQFVPEDLELARQLPALTLIVGGHEHDMRIEKSGSVYIAKAHANARSAYVHKLTIDKKKNITLVVPELRMLDEKISLDSSASLVVKKWSDIASANYATLGFDAGKIVLSKGDSLDGRESEVRSRSTNFTKIIVEAMADATPQADVSIMNGGSIRLDDILYPPITQYDIIRSLPYGGPIREAELKGSLLKQVLDSGIANRGVGGFLHYYPVEYDPTNQVWMLKGDSIQTEKVYRVAFSDFLVTGREAGLSFLNKDNPGMIKLFDAEISPQDPRSDIRLALIRYLEKKNRN